MNYSLKQLFTRKIHLWVVIIFLLLVVGSFALWQKYFGEHTYALQFDNDSNSETAFGSWPSLSNPDFYASVKNEMVSEKESFVEANLSDMILKVYKDGIVVKEAKILTKGRKGSWWETPPGLYRAEDKIKTHLSSFSPVYTPWNIPFQGNFFIHGWPYYAATGEPVTSTYSGGCIRLSSSDAEEVYNLVEVGMPILVFEEKDPVNTLTHVYGPNVPAISAEGYLVADLENNFVFLKQEAEKSFKLSSMRHLLAALVVTDYMNIEKSLTVKSSSVPNTRLEIGETYSVYDLLFPLLLESSFEAEASLTRPLGNIRAVELMVKKAKSIGMTATTLHNIENSFEDSTDAEDIFHLAEHLYNYRKFILNLTNKVVDNNAYGISQFGWLPNSNPLKDIPGYIGGIIGKTAEGKETGLAVFEIDFNGSKRPVAFIILESDSIETDILGMLDYVKKSYK